jgi:hypothetical protein
VINGAVPAHARQRTAGENFSPDTRFREPGMDRGRNSRNGNPASRQVSAAGWAHRRPNRSACQLLQGLENGIPDDRKTGSAALVRGIGPPVPVQG